MLTTVVYRDGILAADTQISINRGVKVRKIFRDEEGNRYGVAGSYDQCCAMVNWLMDAEDGEPPPDFKEQNSFNILMIDTDGQLFMFADSAFPMAIEAPYVAIGSGREVALGAMAMGATAEEAVGIAAQFDPHTGGEIMVEE